MSDRIAIRSELLTDVRNSTAEEVNRRFCHLIGLRNFKGSLIIDHDTEQIDIKVNNSVLKLLVMKLS